jgi:RimJ/RimL family protein N-acetyltransferase
MTISPFQGKRVALRPFEPDDVPVLGVVLNHPDLFGRRYIPWPYSDIVPLSAAQVRGIYEEWCKAEKSLPLAVVLSASGDLIGHAECDWRWDPHCPSVSLVIAPPHQRQGLGAEVLHLLVDYLFDTTPAHTISAWIADWNQPARQFVARHSFQEAGRMRRAGIHRGAYFDLVISDILRSEWKMGGEGHAA